MLELGKMKWKNLKIWILCFHLLGSFCFCLALFLPQLLPSPRSSVKCGERLNHKEQSVKKNTVQDFPKKRKKRPKKIILTAYIEDDI